MIKILGTGNKESLIKHPRVLNRFIVLEGIDGAGTTTQMQLLVNHCQREGIPIISTEEPTKNYIGRTIRAVLRGEEQAHPSTMPILFAADRNEHLFGNQGILYWIEQGYWVVSDRYLFSSLAYQSIDNPYAYVKQLNSKFPLPQLLFFVDVPPETGIKRIQEREKHEIYEELFFQQKVYTQYRKVLNAYKNKGMGVCILDGKKAPEEIHQQIWTFFEKFRY
ncbi:MAG: dTMP kinase [Spirochaetales bacterium]